MKTPIDPVWEEIKKNVSIEELHFLRKCFRSYSSKAHVNNVLQDIKMLRKTTPPPQHILDFGCGIGLQSYLLASNGYQVTGLETIEDKSLDEFLKGKAETHIKSREDSMENVWNTIQQKEDISFKFYDGKDIPFKDGHFDAVFTYAVIEHIPLSEVPHILDELYRVLKSGGMFYIFQLPQRTSYTEFIARTLGLESHPYLWELSVITGMLETRGFRIVQTKRVDMLFNHPHKVINPLYPLLEPLNKILNHTPLSYFAHHLTIIVQKY